MVWEVHKVNGTLIRRKYVFAETKESRRECGLSERFYIACKIRGCNSKVAIFLGLHDDAELIYGSDKRKQDEEGVPVKAVIFEYSCRVDDEKAKDYPDHPNTFHRFLTMHIEPG